jgi:hypothetical protein
MEATYFSAWLRGVTFEKSSYLHSHHSEVS